MKNSGEELEQLVKLVEDILLPKGFTVSPRKRIFDDEGNQIAELDLLISGNLSTTQINWLIECRDRPSDGAAPSSWIEQLFGRRDRLKLDKVTAVSTTGFSAGALDYAEKVGIELRTVEQITREEIEDWFSAESITLYNTLGQLKHAEIEINDTNEEQKKELEEIYRSFDNKASLFIHTGTENKVSLLDIFRLTISQVPGLTDNVEPDQPPRQKIIKVNFDVPKDCYKFRLKNKDAYIACITFIADVSIKLSTIPISKMTKYANVKAAQTIAESIHFDLPTEEGKINLAINKVADQNGNIITFTINDG